MKNCKTNSRTARSRRLLHEVLDRSDEIFISVRIEALRKTVNEVQGSAGREDVAARSGILKALKAQGYKVIATGEGKYADAWVKRLLK